MVLYMVTHTFVVLAYKKSKYLEACIQSVLNQEYRSQVVVATSTKNEYIEELADKYNLKVIYDAAHAFGVTYKGKGIGNYGDASIFSFHATKVFNTIEGGAVTFGDDCSSR